MLDIGQLFRDSKTIGASNTPVDTRNMVSNAFKGRQLKSGFTLSWKEQNAHYVGFVNDGTKFQPAQYFVEATVFDIIDLIQNNDKPSLKQGLLSNIGKTSGRKAQTKRKKRLLRSRTIFKERSGYYR